MVSNVSVNICFKKIVFMMKNLSQILSHIRLQLLFGVFGCVWIGKKLVLCFSEVVFIYVGGHIRHFEFWKSAVFTGTDR